jgi:hypothetical protein
VFTDDFKHHVNVEIRDDGIVALLTSGLKLLPAESEWHGEQGWNENDEKYQ